MKRNMVILTLCLLLTLAGCNTAIDTVAEESTAATEAAVITVTENEIGQHQGMDYELWKDLGTTEMTLTGPGQFACSWKDINNALFRIGKKFDCTKSWQEFESITLDYAAEYYPVGNSYLCVYGWTRQPLVEYYVVQSWGNWRPPGAKSLGTIEVDGATYDVYHTTRVNQPSIDGTATFSQFWSVRKGKSPEGTVTLTDHFKAWEALGLELGNLYEAALTVEGYQSSGFAEITRNTLTVK